VYKDFKTRVGDWSNILWAKLDAENLRVGSEEFDKKRKKLSRVGDNEDNVVFEKLGRKIIEFKESIPLIQ